MNRGLSFYLAWCAAAFAAASLLVAGCGGDSPTSPTSPGPSTATVLSCSSISYRGQTYNASCSIPGQSIQPSALSISFEAGRSDCLNVTCSSGCARTVTVGTLSGSSCR
jgi:hypothetical protein